MHIIDVLIPPTNHLIPPLAPLEHTQQISNPFHFEVYTYTIPPEIEQYTTEIYRQFFSVEGINRLGSWTLTWLYAALQGSGVIGVLGLVVVVLLFTMFIFNMVSFFVYPIKAGWDEEAETEQTNESDDPDISPADRFQREIDDYQRRFY